MTRRERIYNKSDGRCWYCGCELNGRWHIDHIEPVRRSSRWMKTKGGGRELRSTGKMNKKENHIEDNMVPACMPCNIFKHTFTLEQFRKELSKQVQRARRDSRNFRMAEKYGLIEVKEQPIVFYFEEMGL